MAEQKKRKGKGFKGMAAPLKYGDMKKAFATPGMQPGEREMVARIANNRGVSMKKAHAIGARRTARGVSTAGIAGPKDMKARTPKPKDPAKGKGTNDPTPAGLGPGREKATMRPVSKAAAKPKPDLSIPKELLPKAKPPVVSRPRTMGSGSRKAM